MALPKLNSTPSYEVVVPSTGQEVTFRPFLVKEQKTLLIALETQERKDMVRAICRTIESCVEQPLEGKLTTFDVDYLFTKIRSKSVGESSNLLVFCSECDAKNEVTVELDTIEIGDMSAEKYIPLTDTITVEMKYPTYDEFLDNEKMMENSSVTESLMELIITCIDAVVTEEERFAVADQTREEVIAFIESMTPEQFDLIADFVNNIPAIHKEVELTCQSCGTVQIKRFEGLDDFF